MNMRLGLVAGVVAGCGLATPALGVVIAGTSFEVADGTLAQYMDTGDPLVDHALLNNAGQAPVNFTAAGGELGFSSFYTNTRDSVGLTDGDFVGVTNFTGTVGAYTDGVQGFQMSDTDGLMTTTFDAVTIDAGLAPSISIDLFVQETGWETSLPAADRIRVWVEVDGGAEIDLLNTAGSNIDDLGIEGSWMTLSANLSGFTTATLRVELDSNAGTEAIFIDNILFEQLPAPGALCLLALAGLSSRRRRN